MKKLFFIWIISLLFSACDSKELGREEAYQIIKKELQYPKVYDYDIFCSDPAHGARVLEAGLESKGLITVKRTQKMMEIGSPIINFTEKAKPYLLPTSEEDKSSDIQKVKVADEDLLEVTGIKTDNEGKSAIVEYSKGYTNITPFASLVRRNLQELTTHTAYFSLYDDGWRLEKRRLN